MSYDPGREDEKLENRLLREMDRRFTSIDKALSEFEKQLSTVDEKLTKRLDKLDENKRDNRVWATRYLISIIISFILGGGAIGFVEIIGRYLK